MKYNHMYDIAFSVVNESAVGEVTPTEVCKAILKRLTELNDDEILEAIGYCDTYEVEEDSDEA